MKKPSKHIKFNMMGTTEKTSIWTVDSKSSGDCLGLIKWYAPWRQYAFFPSPNTVFSRDCNEAINARIQELMDTRINP